MNLTLFQSKAVEKESENNEGSAKELVTNETDLQKTKAEKLNQEGRVLYEEGKSKEEDEKFEAAIRKYDEAKNKFNEAVLVEELEEIFDSFQLVFEGYVRLKCYENASNVIHEIQKRYPQKKKKVKKMKKLLQNKNQHQIDHLSLFNSNNQQKSLKILIN
jgi:hypothetical protein